jgi:hypothetical protein
VRSAKSGEVGRGLARSSEVVQSQARLGKVKHDRVRSG